MIELKENPGMSLYKVFVTGGQDYRGGRMPEVGSEKVYSDGRRFRFVSTAVNVAAGQVVSAPAAPAELAGKFAVALVGDREVTITLAGVTANQFKDGYLVVTETSGYATTYAIKSNTASDESNEFIATLYEPLAAAIAEANDCILVYSRYANVVVGTAASDAIGVAVAASTAATSGKVNYLWVQTAGVGAVKTGTASALLAGVKMILGAAGVVEAQSTAGIQREVGYVLDITAAVSNGDVVPAALAF